MKRRFTFSEEEVKTANRRFYDLAYRIYEETDGRRGEGLGHYLDKKLEALSREAGRKRLLDLGCGTGFVAERARKYFDRVVGTDISPNVLKKAADKNPEVDFYAADSDALPFRENSFNGVVAVALLHHLFDHKGTFCEVYRVLKPGGILYTDHDLERCFRNLFRIPLLLYRLVRDEEKRYLRACPELTRRLYRATEIHREGLDVSTIRSSLEAVGFKEVRFTYHWLGLSDFFDRVGHFLNREGECRRGFAPSLSIWARK